MGSWEWSRAPKSCGTKSGGRLGNWSGDEIGSGIDRMEK